MRHNGIRPVLKWGAIGIAAAAALVALAGWVVRLLWNWLMPAVFGLPQVTYWQALGIFILAHLLLGSGPRGAYRRDRRGAFRTELKERLAPTPPDAPTA
jgi:hypothetical protein